MSRRPNIVILLADEHSVRAVGAYGPTLADTPNIDRLATEGVLFENAYCNAPICVPSRLSFLTGRYTSQIEAWSNLSEPPSDVPSIQGILRRTGYRTTALGKMHFVGENRFWDFHSRPYGDVFGRGHQPDPIALAPNLQLHPAGPGDIDEQDMQESIVAETGIQQLEKLAGESEPFFLICSFNRPHFPLRPPRRLWEKYYPDRADLPLLPPTHPHELHPWMRHHQRFYRVHALSEEMTRRGRAGYYGCVEFVDEQVGKITDAIDRLGLRDNTVVIYMSDHGEMNGEHGLWLKTNFYEESVRVPLIVRSSTGQRGSRVRDLVELVDLVPTICEIADVSKPEIVDGESLVPLLRGETSGFRDVAISEYYSHSAVGPMRMIRCGDWKYCWFADAKPSLYNLREDPNEFVDLVDDGRLARMVSDELDALMRRGWDEQAARRNFHYRPHFGFAEVHEVNRSPNQFVEEDGSVRDAETFYPGVVWSPWTTLTLGHSGGEFGE